MADKKEGTVGVLMRYAGGYKWLTVLGCVLSALAMVANMAPYVCIWLVARDLIAVAPDWGQATQISMYGWTALGFAILGRSYVFHDGREELSGHAGIPGRAR